ncbi:MAG: protein kinase family protein [Cyanobacteria bacterium SBLK]|nr:protein kinase family protein [Cyanobacteria bacterium SBLK]
MSQPKNSSPQTPTSQSSSRYQKIRELGRSDRCDRITYLAKDNKIQKTVIIKQYIFGNSQSDWAGLKAYKTYAKVLFNLKHSSLPNYLNFFPSKNGFCAVREFKQATSLAAFRHLNLDIVRKIAISLLETLAYLQSGSPFITHYNIKPENILVDNSLNIYLVDFGFPYINKKGEFNTAFAGTSGFMPREQLRNKKLTEASDLYAIGASLTCLIAKISTREINDLLGEESRVSLVEIIPREISFKFVEWLEVLVNPSSYQRYSNALAALDALKAIDLERLPQAKIKPEAIELKGMRYGEKLTETLSVSNTIPDTLLRGKWEIFYQGDYKVSSSSKSNWLVFDPPEFEGNRINCNIIIDTKKLQAEQTYERQIILKTNDEEKTHKINLKIETAPLTNEHIPWLHLAGLIILGILGGSVFGFLFNTVFANYTGFLMGLILGGICGMAGIFQNYALPKKVLGISVILGVLPWNLLLRLSGINLYGRLPLILATLIGLVIFSVTGYILRYSYGQPIQRKEPIAMKEILSPKGTISLCLAISGIFIGMAINAGNLFVYFSIAFTVIPTGIVLYRFCSRQVQLFANYRKIESRLLKP